MDSPGADVIEMLEQAEEQLDSERPEGLRQAIVDFRQVLERHPGTADAYLVLPKPSLN